VITSSSVPLNAFIANHTASTTVTITVNGHTIANANYQVVNGNLTSSIPLTNGTNTISIYAVSPCGSDSETISILRCKNPSANWIYPALVNTVVTNEIFTLEVKANNALDASNVQLVLNGASIPFDYNNITEMVTVTVNLVPGNNVFAIRIQNTCGAANSNITVIYNPTIEAPQNPGNNNNGNSGGINNGKTPQNNQGNKTPSNSAVGNKNKTPSATTKPKGSEKTRGSSSKQVPKAGQPKSNKSSGSKSNSNNEEEAPKPPKTSIKNNVKGKGR
jgi:hypothetical protein